MSVMLYGLVKLGKLVMYIMSCHSLLLIEIVTLIFNYVLQKCSLAKIIIITKKYK